MNRVSTHKYTFRYHFEFHVIQCLKSYQWVGDVTCADSPDDSMIVFKWCFTDKYIHILLYTSINDHHKIFICPLQYML